MRPNHKNIFHVNESMPLFPMKNKSIMMIVFLFNRNWIWLIEILL